MTTQTPVWTQIDAEGIKTTYFHARPYGYTGRRFQGSWMILAVVEGDCEWWTIETGNVDRGLSEVQAHYAIDGQTAYLSVFRHEPVEYLCPTCTTIGEIVSETGFAHDHDRETNYRCPACSHHWTARSDA
jgi:DNA-directed RNA polymerase subunit RPC12/RpoP